MQRYARVFLILAPLLAVLAQPVRGESITVGSSVTNGVTSGYCVPFGCSPGSTFQQVVTNGYFPGVFEITGLSFFNTAAQSGGDQYIDPAHYQISLSTTTAPVAGLSTSNFDANLGANTTVVFSGALGGSAAGEIPPGPGSTLPFTWITPFRYDPAEGNLLIDIRKSGGSFFGDDGTYLDFSEHPAAGFSTVSDFGAAYWNNRRAGLVLRLDGTFEDPAPVPEPATLLLLGAGLAGVAHRVKRQRAVSGSPRQPGR